MGVTDNGQVHGVELFDLEDAAMTFPLVWRIKVRHQTAMAKYKVMCVRYGFTEVEADSESEAIDIAEGLPMSDYNSLTLRMPL